MEVTEEGKYISLSEVARYIYIFHKLPSNYLTKAQAEALGGLSRIWTSTNMYTIGGDIFFNRERLLPIQSGFVYYECDIDSTRGSRGAKRIVFSSLFNVYYTSDHYGSFQQIY